MVQNQEEEVKESEAATPAVEAVETTTETPGEEDKGVATKTETASEPSSDEPVSEPSE